MHKHLQNLGTIQILLNPNIGINVIFLKLEIDNFYMFKNTVIDFTYPKEITNSAIEGEYLEDFPKIKFKRVCILMGANASGKTSFGKVMCYINNYIAGSLDRDIPNYIRDKNKEASIEAVYVIPNSKTIHQLKVIFNTEGWFSEEYKFCSLKKSKTLNDTLLELKNARKHTQKIINNFNFMSTEMWRKVERTNNIWNYMYSDFKSSSESFKNTNLELLEKILKSFDSSINSVAKIKESTNDAYVIKFNNGDDVIVENGEMLNPQRLSRGTLESIEVVKFIDHISSENINSSGSFFLDEKMAYSHSEIEVSVLNLLIEKLHRNSQLFYTTHNYDILEMSLPTHSYIFLKKDEFVEVFQPEKMGYTKNDRSLLGFVKNDVFGTLPDTSKIDSLL